MTAAVIPRPAPRLLVPPMLSTVASVLPTFLTGAVAVQLRDDLGFSAGGLGIAVAAFGAGGAIASTPLGWVSERIGAEWSMRLGALATAAAMLSIAAVVQSWIVLVVVLFAAGVANAIVQPAANLFLVRAIDPGRLGLAFGIKQSAIPAATLLGGAAVPALALTVGWRWAYVGAAAIAVAAALTVPAAPKQLPGKGDRRSRREGDVPMRAMIVLAAGTGFGAAAAGAIGTFLVDSATEAGVANGTAGLLMAGGSVIGLTTRLTSGVRADRRGGGHLKVVWQMLAIGSLTYAGLAVSEPIGFYVAAPIAFASAWGWPALFHLSIVRRNPAAPAAATGITQTGTLIGALAGPLVLGGLAEAVSYRAMWLVAGVCSLVAAATIAHGRRLLLAGDQVDQVDLAGQ